MEHDTDRLKMTMFVEVMMQCRIFYTVLILSYTGHFWPKTYVHIFSSTLITPQVLSEVGFDAAEAETIFEDIGHGAELEIDDVAAWWKRHHEVCLCVRGGEGGGGLSEWGAG